MGISLPWTLPIFGQVPEFDARSFFALLGSMVVCVVLGSLLMYSGRAAKGQHLFRKEAIAVVGLSWLLATMLGCCPSG